MHLHGEPRIDLIGIGQAAQITRRADGALFQRGLVLAHIECPAGQRALDILERAINRDWMFYARSVVFDSALKHLQDDPGYLTLIDRLEQNMARERAWYQEHKDDLQL